MTRIAARFCGPPESANGGYCAGILANALQGAVEVTLRRPPPLERELELRGGQEHAELWHAEELIAEARCASLELAVPQAPSFERALELSRHYFGHRRHHFPGCFVCGPARAVGDGLRIFPGAERVGQPVVAPFRPDASLVDERGIMRPELVWAALDCVGYFAAAAPDYPIALLGRMTAQLSAPVELDERCVVLGWSLGRAGRKLHAGTALFGADGRLCGLGQQTWILLATHQGQAPPWRL